MSSSNGYTFRIVRPDVEIEAMMNRARDAQYIDSVADFAEGVLVTLEWLFDEDEPEPLEE